MVGEPQSITKPEVSASNRSSRLKLLIPAGLVLLAALILFRAAGSFTAVTVTAARTPSAAGGTASDDRSGLAEDGRKLFAQQCASCHGPQGNRIPISPLDSQPYVDSLGSRLEEVITRGRGTMPAWGKDLGGPLDAKQVRSVAEFVRSKQGLAKRDEPAVAAASPKPAPTASPTAEQRQAPPVVKHSLASLDNRCLDCHNRGASVPMPVNHAGRANSTCSFCHAQGPVAVTLSPAGAPASTASTPTANKPAPTSIGTAAPKP